MPRFRWTRLIAILCGVGSAISGTSASAFQTFPPNDDLHTEHLHGAESWIGGGFQSQGPINQSPSDLGPITGMPRRTRDGNPASGDRFPVMQPGSLPGGFDPRGFNSSGMIPPVNQPQNIANNPLFGGGRQNSEAAQNQNSMGWSAQPSGPGPSGRDAQGNYLPNQRPQQPNAFPTQMSRSARPQPKVSNGMAANKSPYVGLLGQVTRPGVYEVEPATTLGDLLQRVDGLAKDSSGQFRIIRNGRSQTASYGGAIGFELMAGDIVVADAQPNSMMGVSSRRTADGLQYSVRDEESKAKSGVQVGFLNLADRPVVLKLREEHANVYAILSLMRQDDSLAPQIKILSPSGQRFQGPVRPDVMLPVNSVLIFPENGVNRGRLTALPEPTKLNRNPEATAPTKAPAEMPSPAATPITPDITQSPGPAQTVTEVPLPPAEVAFSGQRQIGIPSAPRKQEQIARDTDMALAPPAEDSTGSPSTRDISDSTAMHRSETAPVPRDLTWVDRDEQVEQDEKAVRPSLLKPQPKLIPLPKGDAASDDESSIALTADESEETKVAKDKAASRWSIWPPILTAGFGVLALFGFSLSLRRRTVTTAHQSPPLPQPTLAQPTPARKIDSSRTLAAVATPIVQPSMIQTAPRSGFLDALINNQVPLIEEQIPLASPMQFHGRPQPQKTLRLDQEHSIPKPHSGFMQTRPSGSDRMADAIPAESPRTAKAIRTSSPQPAASNIVPPPTQKIRIERTVASSAGSPPTTAAEPRVNSVPNAPHIRPTVGALDRALSAVQQREERGS